MENTKKIDTLMFDFLENNKKIQKNKIKIGYFPHS